MSLLINTETKELTLNVAKYGRTRRQRERLEKLFKERDIVGLLRYTQSFDGKREYIDFPKPRLNSDALQKSEGSVLQMLNGLSVTENTFAPSARSKGRWFGVEIECFVNRHKLAKAVNSYAGDFLCSDCGGAGEIYNEDDDSYDECNECNGYRMSLGRIQRAFQRLFKNNGVRRTAVKTDGSLSIDDNDEMDMLPLEIVTLTRSDDEKNLKNLCAVLEMVGAKVNRSCGLHVHLDARTKTAEEVQDIGKKFGKVLPALASVVPKSRRSNNYCSLSVSDLRGDRYCAVNLTSFRKYSTIEIRLHSATTNFKKIINWVRLLESIFDAESMKPCTTLNELEQYISISEETFEYFSQREALFGPYAASDNFANEYLDNDDLDQDLEMGA